VAGLLSLAASPKIAREGEPLAFLRRLVIPGFPPFPGWPMGACGGPCGFSLAGRLDEAVAYAHHVLLQEHGAESCESSGWVAEDAQDRFAVVDRVRDVVLAGCDRGFEFVGGVGVVVAAEEEREVDGQAVGEGDACEPDHRGLGCPRAGGDGVRSAAPGRGLSGERPPRWRSAARLPWEGLHGAFDTSHMVSGWAPVAGAA